ncbi:hypothetical protein MRX96_039864 [Rhipicephalus microplus]
MVRCLLLLLNLLLWFVGISLIWAALRMFMDSWDREEEHVLERLDISGMLLTHMEVLLFLFGLAVFNISSCGCVGALRENTFLLGVYSLCTYHPYCGQLCPGRSGLLRAGPAAQASWDDRHIAALECYAAESAAETSNQSAGRSQNEATLAFLEARYNQDLEMRLLSYQIDKRKLDLKIRQHDDKMKLQHQQHADNVRLREAEMEMRRMEMVAVLEERRANAAYQASQLQLIKELIQGKKE